MAKKIGYFRVIGTENYTISYTEAYARGSQFLSELREKCDNGEVSLFCACQEDNSLPLFVTKNNVIRVTSNGGQLSHKDSCPKSENYALWNAENKATNGVQLTEDNQILLNIAIPSGMKSESKGKSTGKSEADPNPFKKRANEIDIGRIVNCVSTRKQTYSVKKAIKQLKAEGKPLDEWEYKDLTDFNKLWFGVSHEINIYHSKEIQPLVNFLYRTDLFYSADFHEKFYMYAVVDKVNYKAERKYQYITVLMPSKMSRNKATIRVATDLYEKLKESYFEGEDTGIVNVLTGWIRHDLFQAVTQTDTTEWITLLKGGFMQVTESHGMYLRVKEEKELIDRLCDEKIVFFRPFQGIESYGGECPTLLIERKGDAKDILVDVCATKPEYEKRKAFAEENKDYDYIVVEREFDLDAVMEQIKNQIMRKG